MDIKATTLFQYWLVNYIGYYLSATFEKDSAHRLASEDIKAEFERLLQVEYSSDQDFLNAFRSKLNEIMLKEPVKAFTPPRRGAAMYFFLGHLQCLVSDSFKLKVESKEFTILDVFRMFGLLNFSVVGFLKPNREIHSEDITRLPVIICKRNIIEYLVDKHFYEQYFAGDYLAPLPDYNSYKINMDLLRGDNIRILTGFGQRLKFDTSNLRISILECIGDLRGARGSVPVMGLIDGALRRGSELWGKKYDDTTDSMRALTWVLENLLDMPEGQKLEGNIDILKLITASSYNKLKKLPESIRVDFIPIAGHSITAKADDAVEAQTSEQAVVQSQIRGSVVTHLRDVQSGSVVGSYAAEARSASNSNSSFDNR